MLKQKFYLFFYLMIIFLTKSSYSQQTNLDYKISNAGPIKQIITNMGHFGAGLTNYTGHLEHEYPIGSHVEYGPYAIWIGGILNEKKLVTTGGPWSNHFQNRHEFFPTSQPWDTVWVVQRGETVNIPFWKEYTGVSDQDIISHYNDYTIKNIVNHEPLYIDIIQTTFAWTSMEFLVHQFWIVPKAGDIKRVFFGIFGNMQIGLIDAKTFGLNDEFGLYDVNKNLGIEEDLPDGDDNAPGPVGFKIFTDIPEDSVRWTWLDGSVEGWNVQEPPNNDNLRYNYMKAGIFHDPLQDRKYGHFLYAVGPFNISLNDTLHITLGVIHGIGMEGLLKNYNRLLWLRERDYHLPSPPPKPPLRIEIGNHQVTLRWNPRPGDINPETYTDKYRADGDPQPFEGYRVYKSTESINGPWFLLAEYDRDDDNIGDNIGIKHYYTDVGLLNNLEYYYTVTAFSKPDSIIGIPAQESSLSGNAVLVIPGTAPPSTVGKVAVVPNPYRGDVKYYGFKPPWEKPSFGNTWIEEDRRIQFINLPSPSKITIYTVSGKYVNTIYHNDSLRGFEDWNLTSYVGQTIASGIYLYTVEDLKSGNIQVGKFVVIK